MPILFIFYRKLAFSTPAFSKIQCSGNWTTENGDKYDLCLEVDYEANKQNDVALLSQMNGLDTVYWGHLLKERTNVAVTIENPSDRDELVVKFS